MVTVGWLLAALVCLPLLIFAIEAAAGLAPAARPAASRTAPPFTVLIPAHDEADGIAATIAHVRRQLRPGDRLLVVADNCADATAAVALRAGAAVCRRDDPRKTGKAHALAFGRDVLRSRPTPVVIVLDADCRPAVGALALLAEAAARAQRPVQGRNLLAVDDDAAPLVRISSFAFLVKNLVRQRGLQRLSGGALLQGTGMALPWRLFDAAPLASASLVEDMELGLELAMAGYPAVFVESAGFVSRAGSQAAMQSQRTRWEHGSLATAVAVLPRLTAVIVAGRIGLLPLAAHLLVPPLALLAVAVAAVAGVLSVLALVAGAAGPLILLLASALPFALLLGLAWHRFGRELLPASALLRLPRYVFWKRSIYRRLATDRERRWIRTSRAP